MFSGICFLFKKVFVRNANAPQQYAKDITTNVNRIFEIASLLTIEKTMSGTINNTK